jgi:hypothetical protein
VAPRLLSAGPDGIDLRPVPGAILPAETLPAEVAGYVRGECHPLVEFRDVYLGSDAVEATYIAPRGSVRVVAARLANRDAAAIVRELTRQLESFGSLGSHRLVSEELCHGCGTASCPRSFVSWHAPEWGGDRHGLAWQSGAWLFIVASGDPVARRDVALGFPY